MPLRHPGPTRRAMPGMLLSGASLFNASMTRGASPALVPSTPAWTLLPPTPALPPPDSTGFLETQGARLFHARFGTGEPVLLLHGGLASANYWGHLIPVLARTRQVLVMDARGHGRSTLGEAGLTYPLLARDALALLDALDIPRLPVIGWSDGGIAGLALAMMAPRRVSRLFTSGANYNRAGGRPDAPSHPTVRAYEARCVQEHHAMSPRTESFDRLRQALGRMWRGGPDYTTAQLATIRIPATIAAGEHDEFITAAHTRALADAIPGARLVIQSGLSHFALLQDPARFAADVMRFLTS